MARVHRLGQEREVHVSRLCAATSIEDFLIHDLLPQKLKVIQENFLATGSAGEAGEAVKEEREGVKEEKIEEEAVEEEVDEIENEDENEDEDEKGDWAERAAALEDALGVLEALETTAEGGKAINGATKVQSIAQGVAQYWGGQGGSFSGGASGISDQDGLKVEPKQEKDYKMGGNVPVTAAELGDSKEHVLKREPKREPKQEPMREGDFGSDRGPPPCLMSTCECKEEDKGPCLSGQVISGNGDSNADEDANDNDYEEAPDISRLLSVGKQR